jgi:hypothetical protein
VPQWAGVFRPVLLQSVLPCVIATVHQMKGEFRHQRWHKQPITCVIIQNWRPGVSFSKRKTPTIQDWQKWCGPDGWKDRRWRTNEKDKSTRCENIEEWYGGYYRDCERMQSHEDVPYTCGFVNYRYELLL